MRFSRQKNFLRLIKKHSQFFPKLVRIFHMICFQYQNDHWYVTLTEHLSQKKKTPKKMHPGLHTVQWAEALLKT
jgi:hypothetical protein